MIKNSVSHATGLSTMLLNGEPLANLRGHANRIREEIAATAAEVGGDPKLSQRFRASVAIVALVDRLARVVEAEARNIPVIMPSEALDCPDIAAPSALERVLEDVARERRRQVEKGYTQSHDDDHTDGRIASEACLAIDPKGLVEGWVTASGDVDGRDRRRELVQGIALAVAEVERLDRRAVALEDPL